MIRDHDEYLLVFVKITIHRTLFRAYNYIDKISIINSVFNLITTNIFLHKARKKE